MFGLNRRGMRSGRPTPLRPIGSAPDLHRLGAYPDHLDIVPPFTRDWGQYQTFWRGNQLPDEHFNQTQYTYAYGAIRKDRPGMATFRQLHAGTLNRQVGGVSMSRLLDKMRQAWGASQG